MKTFRYLILFAGLFVVLGSCTQKKSEVSAIDPSVQSTNEQKKKIYVCPMHPHIKSDKPDRCSICGMDLVLQEGVSLEKTNTADKSSQPEGHAGFHVSNEKLQKIGVRFTTVIKKPFFKEIEASGRVAFDPELYTAQNEYQEALKQLESIKNSPLTEVRQSGQKMMESARMRLKILGLSDRQINDLKSSASDQTHLLVTKAGEKIWVYAEVFEMDLASVRPGLAAKIYLTTRKSQPIAGQVVAVDRLINSQSRSAKVRIQMINPTAELRPESYVNVSILSPQGPQLVIPMDAVIDSGKEAWVFVKKSDDYIEPRKISISIRSGDEVVVDQGLNENEVIVSSGNFLIDSESRLRAVFQE